MSGAYSYSKKPEITQRDSAIRFLIDRVYEDGETEALMAAAFDEKNGQKILAAVIKEHNELMFQDETFESPDLRLDTGAVSDEARKLANKFSENDAICTYEDALRLVEIRRNYEYMKDRLARNGWDG